MAGPLDGIKVLDITHAYSGTFCTLILRDLGAEVIKVERQEGGDPVRNDAPRTKGLEGGTFIMLNRGKKSITLNLKSEKGLDICRELAKRADVVVQNFAPGAMDKLGLGSKDLCELNPGLIYASLSAYGQTGPRRNELGYDPMGQAMGGLMAVTGFPDGPPTRAGVAIADFSSGLYTALAIVSAVFHRTKTGEGQTIDISMQDCIWLFTAMEYVPHYFLAGKVPPRFGNGNPNLVPANVYPAKDGSVFISAISLAQVQTFFRLIGGEELVNSPLCCPQAERLQYKDQIDAMVAEWTKARSVEEIMDLCREAEVPCTVVPTLEQVCNDPHLYSREMIIEIEQPISGKITSPGSVFKLDKTPGNIRFPAPFLGEHNYEVLSSMLGYTESEIKQLDKDGII